MQHEQQQNKIIWNVDKKRKRKLTVGGLKK